MKKLSQKVIKDLITYDPQTGEVFWNKRPREYFKTADDCAKWNGKWAGKTAGSLRSDGRYYRITLLDTHYLLHRVIVLYVEGVFPKRVFFKDSNFGNLKWDNLKIQVEETCK